MKATNKLILATAISHVIAFGANAAVPNTFTAGQPALASEVNENFSSLDSRIESLEDRTTDTYQTVAVDCTADAGALAAVIEDARNAPSRVTYEVTGKCNAVEIFRADIKIDGTNGGSIAADPDLDGESLFIDAQSNVRLINLTLDGYLYARNSSNVRFESVTLPALGSEPNVQLRNSYLRVNTGSVNNLSLHANRNSTVDIKDEVTGDGVQLVADANSTIVVDNNVISFNFIEAVASSFIYGDFLEATEIVSGSGSVVEANGMYVGDFLDVWGSSRVYVSGDIEVGELESGRLSIYQNSSMQVDGSVTSGQMECSNSSSFDIDVDLTVRGTLDWSDQWGLAIQRGCHGKFGEHNWDTNETVGAISGGYMIDNHSTLHDPKWEPLATTGAL